MIVEIQKGGNIIYENKADKSLIELLTKRFNPKKRYSANAIQIFNDLNLLTNMPKHRSSKKSKLGGAIYFTNPEQMVKRLELLIGSLNAGNSSIQLKNELYDIIDHLLKLKILTKDKHNAFIKKYLI